MKKLRQISEYVDLTDGFLTGNEGSSMGSGDLDKTDEPQTGQLETMEDDAVSYSLSVSQRMEQPNDVPQGYSVEKSMDRAWMQVEAQPIQQFWEKGFWAEIFGDSTSTSASSITTALDLHRPAVPNSGKLDMEPEEDVGFAVSLAKRARMWSLNARFNPGRNNGTACGRQPCVDGTVAFFPG